MLAYAAHRRPPGASASPTSLMLIVGAHAVALGLVITAKSDFAPRLPPVITNVFEVPLDMPPPPPPEPVTEPQVPNRTTITTVKPIVTTISDDLNVDETPTKATTVDPYPGNEVNVPVKYDPPPLSVTRVAARFATPEDLVRPPYPASKQRLEEEASLRLALSIDSRGRVVGVEPIGVADPEFLAAARKHILKYWRYKPATENGTAVASRTELTLKFELDE